MEYRPVKDNESSLSDIDSTNSDIEMGDRNSEHNLDVASDLEENSDMEMGDRNSEHDLDVASDLEDNDSISTMEIEYSSSEHDSDMSSITSYDYGSEDMDSSESELEEDDDDDDELSISDVDGAERAIALQMEDNDDEVSDVSSIISDEEPDLLREMTMEEEELYFSTAKRMFQLYKYCWKHLGGASQRTQYRLTEDDKSIIEQNTFIPTDHPIFVQPFCIMREMVELNGMFIQTVESFYMLDHFGKLTVQWECIAHPIKWLPNDKHRCTPFTLKHLAATAYALHRCNNESDVLSKEDDVTRFLIKNIAENDACINSGQLTLRIGTEDWHRYSYTIKELLLEPVCEISTDDNPMIFCLCIFDAFSLTEKDEYLAQYFMDCSRLETRMGHHPNCFTLKNNKNLGPDRPVN